MKSRSLSLYASILCLAVTVHGQAPPEPALTTNPIFQKECAKCHGKTATGRHFAGPSLIGQKIAQTSAEDLRSIIQNGQKRMPKFDGKLSSSEINTLVEEINALNHR